MRWRTIVVPALLVQPSIVVGLIYERSGSLTNTIFWSSPVTASLGVFMTALLVVGWLSAVTKCYRFVPGVFYGLALCMGTSAAITVSSEAGSYVLIGGYLLEMILLFWASYLMTHNNAK